MPYFQNYISQQPFRGSTSGRRKKRMRRLSPRPVSVPPLRTRCFSRSRQVLLLLLQSSLRYFYPAERVLVCLSYGQCHDPAGALHILPGGTRLGVGGAETKFPVRRRSGVLGGRGAGGIGARFRGAGECVRTGVPARRQVARQEGSGAPSLLRMPRSLGRSWGPETATPNQQVND